VLNEIKNTLGINLEFTHAVAWLMGLSTRINTLDSYIVLRTLLKYLTTKGVFFKATFNNSAIFRDNITVKDVPLYSPDQAYTNIKNSGMYSGIPVDMMINPNSKNVDYLSHDDDE
jgi:hypothetical protein